MPGMSQTEGCEWNAVIEADTSCVTSLKEIFAYKTEFNGNLTAWDVSAVQTFEDMFVDTYAFTGENTLCSLVNSEWIIGCG